MEIHTVSKMLPFYILHNSANNEPISVTFGEQNPDEVSKKNIINSSISPK